MPFNSRHINRDYAGGSVNGILRKANHIINATSTASTSTEARQVDLLVFGYACKIFRDDDKAREIDQGKHLIPWMGDDNLKIDRYDVRGALSDLTPYEPPPGGYGNRLDYLTPEEQRAEQLCEEERYLFLYNNEEDIILQQEEDLKRLKEESGDGVSYNQVGFQYETIGIPHGPNPEDAINGEEPEQAFVLPRNFQVPADIRLPETMKQHAIIEKTARFISTQGAQMEILLKAKQSNNVQFEFLNQDSLLNPYYKFVLNAFKSGTYPKDIAPQDGNSFPTNDNNSLTSSLYPNFSNYGEQQSKTVITVPTIKYKPSANCAYTQLISKIKGVPLPTFIAEGNDNTVDSNRPTTPILLQYNNNNTYVQADESERNSNDNSNQEATRISPSTVSAAVSSNSSSSLSNNSETPQVEILKNSSALALAQGYSSYSDTENEDEGDDAANDKENPKAATQAGAVAKGETGNQPEAEPEVEPNIELTFPVPTDNLKNIIDKTAIYVKKNGRQFEETLMSKSADRFQFLLFENIYYPYYLYKITGDPNAASKEQKKRKAQAVAEALIKQKKLKNKEKTLSPVSFSIKKDDHHSGSAGLAHALPQEPSDDDDEESKVQNNAANRSVPESVQKAIRLVESQLMARSAQMASASNPRAMSPKAPKLTSKRPLASTKAEIERNALFEQQQQNRQKEIKMAEEKVKDKLAQIAREKLGLLSKEKQLQMERKRKAMAFLNQIKSQTSKGGGENKSSAQEEKAGSNDSDDSARSIPITSYGPDEKSDEDNDESMRTPAVVNPCSGGTTLKSNSLPNDDEIIEAVTEGVTLKPSKNDVKRRSRSRTRESKTSPAISSASRSKVSNEKTYRKRSASSSSNDSEDSSGSSDKDEENDDDEGYDRKRKKRKHSRSKSSHKSSTAKKSKKSSKSKKKHKKKSKRIAKSRSRSRSHTRTRSRSYRSKSHHYASRSPSTSSKKIHKKASDRDRRRSYSSSSEYSSSCDSHYSGRHRSRDRKTAEKSSSSSSMTRKHKDSRYRTER